MNFKVGQIVKLKEDCLSRGYRACSKDRAIVIKKIFLQNDSEQILIKWMRTTNHHLQQSDGYYNVVDFEPVIQVGEQLLFDFMRD